MNKRTTKYIKFGFVLAVTLPILYYVLTLNAFDNASQVRADVNGEYVELTPGSSTLFTRIKDKFKNFKISKIAGTDKKAEDKEYYLIDSRKPKIRFKRPTDSDSVIFFRLLIINSEGNWKKKSEKTYIDHIDNVRVDGDDKQVVKEDDYEVTYTKNYIEVKPKSNDLKLKKGQYFFMVQTFDTDNNYSDSGGIKVKVVDSIEDETTSKLNNDLDIKVDKVGSIPYKDAYKLFYYSNPNLSVYGHVEHATEGIELEVYVDDALASTVKTDSTGNYVAPLHLKYGANKIQLRTKLVTESGIKVTKDLNITIR